jgi:3-deoxy-D-manno-octulosonate 8-phosphate phosphatase (KDO 8-P phosphatase)
LACAPPNAHREVLSRVHWVTQAPAGHGAVREVCDLLLQARGDYAPLLNQVVL